MATTLILALVIYGAIYAVSYLLATRASPAEVKVIPHALIVTQLEPLFAKLPLRRATIKIIAGDLYYFDSQRGDRWISILRSWLQKGARVEYVIVSAGDFSGEIARIRQKIALDASPGRIDFFFSLHKMDAARARYQTLHPTLVRLASGRRALWVEGEHKLQAAEARDVLFVPPGAMNSLYRAQFDAYERDFDAIRDELASASASAPETV